jgi:autotransporter-associated beta strand protein
VISGSAINVATGATLNVSAITGGSGDLIKTGGGTLELSGALANTMTGVPRVKQGTLFFNKAAGVNAVNTGSSTFVIGDDVSGNSATLRLGASNQFPTSDGLQIATNGTVDFNGAIDGNIRAKTITIRKDAVVRGEVEAGGGGDEQDGHETDLDSAGGRGVVEAVLPGEIRGDAAGMGAGDGLQPEPIRPAA